MELNIPADQFQKLTERALAAGYADVTALIAAIAEEPTCDPCGPLSEEQLRANAAECDRRVAEIQAGRGLDFREAMAKLGRERGYPIPE